MDIKELIYNYWQDVASQNRYNLRKYFQEEAIINWHNTNESFTVDEFIIANCDYPGNWFGEVERVEIIDNLVITVVRVYDNENISCHVVSFFIFQGDLIIQLDEYWGDDGTPPKWRLDKQIGRSINKNHQTTN